jgi:Cof subfamily protein (haloacid dehalogenase superfamily)
MASPRYRILALDVDGTLLDSEGTLRLRTVDAVRRAARAGIRPVLCTGRRFRRVRPIAAQLGLDTPIVCNSGAIVKDPSDQTTLWRADLSRELTGRLLGLFLAHDQAAVAFADRLAHEHDFVVSDYPTGRPCFDDYVGQNREHAEIDLDWLSRWSRSGSVPVSEPCFHVCAIGTRSEMLAFQRVIHDALAERVQTFVQRSPRYLGTMCEVLRHDASKWTAVLHLASLWNIAPEEICAVGDDVNDVPMIRHAGLGVAMGHASADVRAAADFVTGDHEADGVAMLVEDILLAS